MIGKAWGSSVLGAALLLSPALASKLDAFPQKKEAPPISKFLLRKDLLAPKQKEFVMPKRNLFSTMTYESSGIPAAGVVPSLGRPDSSGQTQNDSSTPGDLLNFRYIGYVMSRKGVTAVVLLDGLPYPVSVGDVLGQGIKILKITPENIEIQGPDSVKKTFALEGERE